MKQGLILAGLMLVVIWAIVVKSNEGLDCPWGSSAAEGAAMCR